MSSSTDPAAFAPEAITTVLCDLDGVVWLSRRPIPGSVEAVAALRASGRRVVFVTNNSASTVGENVEALERVGVHAAGDVFSSAPAGAHLVEAGERVLVVGGRGIHEAVRARGAVPVAASETAEPSGFDALIVGLDRNFDYDRLAVAASAVRAGARLIATNSDATYPTPHGLLPGGGSIVAAVATASGVDPVVAGKPHPPMAELIVDELASSDGSFDPGSALMVGDRPDTDGLFARALGCAYALVRSGVTPPWARSPFAGFEADPTVDADDLAAVAASLTDRRPPK